MTRLPAIRELQSVAAAQEWRKAAGEHNQHHWENVMRHAERVVFWKTPKNREEWQNSMVDAFVAMPRGKVLIYRHERITEHGTAQSEFGVAASVAARLGGSLVQWPDDVAANDRRKWCFGIEKPSVPA